MAQARKPHRASARGGPTPTLSAQEGTGLCSLLTFGVPGFFARAWSGEGEEHDAKKRYSDHLARAGEQAAQVNLSTSTASGGFSSLSNWRSVAPAGNQHAKSREEPSNFLNGNHVSSTLAMVQLVR